MLAEQSHETKGLIRLTMACNERCTFCNVPMEDYHPLATPEADLRTTLDRLIESGAKTATISGGEPTLMRSRLLETVAYLRRNGLTFIELQTNAVLVDSNYASALSKSGVTSAFVSFLSHIPQHHDDLCGLPGAYDKCMNGIDALLDAEISVTLNPVIAASTQHLIAAYLQFVATRFPRIQYISLSAIQPHGRAAQNLHLLPDYGPLRQHVRDAHRVSIDEGLTLLNPYCGLPLCVGWETAQMESVEAMGSLAGDTGAFGINNLGNKRQDKACHRCALRTRCGGAWHAVWDVRDGAGIEPPAKIGSPWEPGWMPNEYESYTRFSGASDELVEMKTSDKPTRWVSTESLSSRLFEEVLHTGITDWAWLIRGQMDQHKSMIASTRRQLARQAIWPQQSQIQFHWVLEDAVTPEEAHRWVGLAYTLGVTRVSLVEGDLPDMFWEACSVRYPELDVGVLHV